MPDWLSGTKQAIGCFNAGELVTVLLNKASGSESPAQGIPPCLRFEPATTPSTGKDPHAIHSTKEDDKPFFLLDLAPFYLPYNGTIYLFGGSGATYSYTVRRVVPRIVPAHAYGPRLMTLRQVSAPGLGPTTADIPPGTAAITVPVDSEITVAAAGETKTLDLIAGQRVGISNWGACGGTFEAVTPSPAIIFCEVYL